MLNSDILLQALMTRYPDLNKSWDKYLSTAKNQGELLGDYLQRISKFDDSFLKESLAKAYGVEAALEVPLELYHLTSKFFPSTLAELHHIAAFDEDDDSVYLVTSNPANTIVLDALRKKISKNIKLYYAFSYEIERGLKQKTVSLEETYENFQKGSIKGITDIESLKNSSKLLDSILVTALEQKASDIHIEPHEGRLIVRIRVDGVLQDIIELPSELADIIVSRIKVLAELRTDEHFKPQDGRFKLTLSDKNDVTTRVSILPVYDGEKVVMRILKSKRQRTDLTDLGYTDTNQAKIYSNAHKAHGMLLVTGPTGSGKTTTIYTVLKLLNNPDVNITTIEDPVEYKLDRVNQIQVNNVAGLTFSAGLRSILRQDPDIILVGEIRDDETAGIAVNAALTGHLVLATLHTNSAIDSLPRLLEMNIEPYLAASTVNVVIAQRLVRKLCDRCKVATKFDDKLLNSIQSDDEEFASKLREYAQKYLQADQDIYQAKGCAECGDSGYNGRLAIAEVLEVTDKIKELIYSKASPIEIERVARSEGYLNFLEDGFMKVAKGQTSLSEVIRITKE
jgi:type IV pilus assembly protein PilB